mmetsp:Transcript_5253/g.19663  ORF Transcript_5253/g.19663 Transcript_5253/m.19663 type:complete len:203 (+) Transcript_5253:1818-2426(+)
MFSGIFCVTIPVNCVGAPGFEGKCSALSSTLVSVVTSPATFSTRPLGPLLYVAFGVNLPPTLGPLTLAVITSDGLTFPFIASSQSTTKVSPATTTFCSALTLGANFLSLASFCRLSKNTVTLSFPTSAFTSTEDGLVFSFTGFRERLGVAGFAIAVILNPRTDVTALTSKFLNSALAVFTAEVVASVTFIVVRRERRRCVWL